MTADDTDATVGLCTYDSCDDWGGQGCYMARWYCCSLDSSLGQGWWNCAKWGGQVCGLAEVNFEVIQMVQKRLKMLI